MVDHELMQSLEYDGPYGVRYTCSQCVHFKEGACAKLPEGVQVSGHNNVCRSFDARIKNPSAPAFNFDDYLEFLSSDFYRPYSIDKEIINGSARLGEVIADSGKLARLLPKVYSPWYKYYDKPYCRVFMPRCHVKIGDHKFEIDYRLYRELSFIKDGEIHFDLHYWKDKPTQRKYQKETYGRWRLASDQ
jgi:hypothetical protein